MTAVNISAFVHRASIILIAIAAAAALVANNQGVDLGLTSTQIAAITAASVSISTIARSVSDSFNRTAEVFQTEIGVLRDAVRNLSSRGDVRHTVEVAVENRTTELEAAVKEASIPNS